MDIPVLFTIRQVLTKLNRRFCCWSHANRSPINCWCICHHYFLQSQLREIDPWPCQSSLTMHEFLMQWFVTYSDDLISSTIRSLQKGMNSDDSGIARHRGFVSLTHSKSQSRIVVTSAAAHGRIVKTVKKVTTYMVGTVKRQNTSSSERSWRKIAETRQSLFRKSAWSGYAHKMCAVDSNTKRLYSNEMSNRATHFTVFMIMNCPVEQQILAAYGSIVDSRRTFATVSLYLNYSKCKEICWLLLTLLERHI